MNYMKHDGYDMNCEAHANSSLNVIAYRKEGSSSQVKGFIGVGVGGQFLIPVYPKMAVENEPHRSLRGSSYPMIPDSFAMVNTSRLFWQRFWTLTGSSRKWCEALQAPFNWNACKAYHNNKWHTNERKPEKTPIRLGFAV